MSLAYQYVVLRCVPRVEREEFINVGAVVFCRTKKHLAAQVQLDETRVRALFREIDIEMIREHLEMIPKICEGGESAGPIGKLSQSERFNWIVAPKSTMVQCSPVHSGVCTDAEGQLQRLVEKMVKV